MKKAKSILFSVLVTLGLAATACAAQKDLAQYLMRAALPEGFENYAAQHGLPRRGALTAAARNFLRRYLVRYLVSDVQGEAEAVKYYNTDDPYLREAMKSFRTPPPRSSPLSVVRCPL